MARTASRAAILTALQEPQGVRVIALESDQEDGAATSPTLALTPTPAAGDALEQLLGTRRIRERLGPMRDARRTVRWTAAPGP